MIQETPVNSELIETLTQIILSLNEQERQLLLHQLQDPSPNDAQSLQQKISIGAQQLLDGEYTEYTDKTLPELLGEIRSRGQNRLNLEFIESVKEGLSEIDQGQGISVKSVEQIMATWITQ
jgi:vacuolar-type H+-ATPase subunit E/Vma4